MIVVNVSGGLGNQLFQYYFGYGVACRQGCDLGLDISSFRNYKWHKFELEDFGLDCTIVRRDGPDFGTRLGRVMWRIPALRSGILRDMRLYRDPGRFTEQFATIGDGSYAVGYFQSDRYLSSIRPAIIEKFDTLRLRHLTPVENFDFKNTCAIHVRLGNYLSNSKVNAVHGVLAADYYRDAIQKVREKYPDVRFVLYSDQPLLARERLENDLGPLPISKSSQSNQFGEFFEMRSCRHHIVANSTFSWWAAWSASDASGLKIAPRNWFSNPDKAEVNDIDLVPSTWIRC